jgi:hypothetical protein
MVFSNCSFREDCISESGDVGGTKGQKAQLGLVLSSTNECVRKRESNECWGWTDVLDVQLSISGGRSSGRAELDPCRLSLQ